MESFLGFSEPAPENDGVSEQSHSFKLVPWLSWDEWDCVRSSLFSSSPHSITSALQRIAAWRNRECLPVVVEVTASIVEIQQKDPFFRNDLNGRAVDSDEVLSMLYCMAIMRLVNCVIERTRKKTEISIAVAAEAIGIPRMLIDIRHEGSHRDLPSLQLVRVASVKALDWLKSFYWEPQKHVIPSQTDVTADLQKRIRNKLQDLLISLKAKKTTRLETSTMKGKSAKRLERLCGPNKFLPFMSVKNAHTKTLGFKKQLTKSLNSVLRLYSSSSAEVVDALIEFLLKTLELSGITELCQQNREDTDMPYVLNDWKHVITKLANKKPVLLLFLVKAILDKIEAQENRIDEGLKAENMGKASDIRLLCFLFDWAVKILCSRKPARNNNNVAEAEDDSCKEKIFSEGAILGLVRRCVAASYGNSQLMTCALALGHMLENKTLDYKLEKLVSLTELDQEDCGEEAWSIENGYGNLLFLEKDLIDQASRTEDLIQLFQSKGKRLGSRDDNDVEINRRWVVSKSWNPCPIGMLTDPLGSSSGKLPILDCKISGPEKLTKVKCDKESNKLSSKIDDLCDIEPQVNLLQNNKTSEMDRCQLREDEETLTWSCENLKGHVMIDGVWKKVTEEEILAIASAIRILI